jgi:hypothetical protein
MPQYLGNYDWKPNPQTMYDFHLYEVREWKRHNTWKKDRFYW